MKTKSQPLSRRFPLRTPRSALACSLRLEPLEERMVLSSFLGGFGGTGSEVANTGATTDPSGNSYLSGSFNSQPADFDPGPGAYNLSSAGGNDALLAKYGSDGSLGWARSFGGSGSDVGLSAAYASEATGNFVYFAGTFTGSADFGPSVGTLTSAGSGDIFLLKLDAATGDTVWGLQFGGPGNDFLPTLAAANDRIYMSGGFRDTVDFDPGPGTVLLDETAGGSGFVLTLGPDGNYVAAWQPGAAAFSLLVEGDSLYLRGGGSTSAWTSGYSIAGQSPANPQATLAWTQSLPTGSSSQGTMAGDASALYIPMSPNSDAMVVKLSKADGSIQWTKQLGGSGGEWATSAVVDPATGMLYVGGQFDSPTVDFNPSAPGGEVSTAGGSDGFILKLRTDTGAYENVWRLGGTENSDMARVYGVHGSTINVTGTFMGTADFPTGGTLTSQGGTDAFLMRLDQSALPPPPATKFYVVDDGSTNKTFEYAASGAAIENYAINSGNTAPRGAASTAAGDKVWVVDSNKKVYVYNTSGGLLGSWSAGSLPSNANVQGITTNGADVWIVDSQGDKVYRYSGAASRTSGSQNAASSFSLNSSNKDATDLVTDGTSIWVLNNSSTDKVFKYTVSGTLQGSWTISGGGGSPTGLTIDPSGSSSSIWIVDSASDRVYEFTNAKSRTSGSQSPATHFALASANTNPQGIADPPALSGTTAGSPSSASHDAALLAIADEFSTLLSSGKRRR